MFCFYDAVTGPQRSRRRLGTQTEQQTGALHTQREADKQNTKTKKLNVIRNTEDETERRRNNKKGAIGRLGSDHGLDLSCFNDDSSWRIWPRRIRTFWSPYENNVSTGRRHAQGMVEDERSQRECYLVQRKPPHRFRRARQRVHRPHLPLAAP